eukprot:TRINITY_DN1152_c0_g4_i1.p1 TRINITY_DN1152_c0_g4~~TRINITY_DN1152_c0_g4_i1.p1  ORF type:complete len:347 (-),score=86.97 TRINITY_DN1152_c0_g4_i1:144-1184(-)
MATNPSAADCVFFLKGSCTKSPCVYRHQPLIVGRSVAPCRFFASTGCTNPDCKFAHTLQHQNQQQQQQQQQLQQQNLIGTLLNVLVGNSIHSKPSINTTPNDSTICKFYASGNCRDGVNCKFKHVDQETKVESFPNVHHEHSEAPATRAAKELLQNSHKSVTSVLPSGLTIKRPVRSPEKRARLETNSSLTTENDMEERTSRKMPLKLQTAFNNQNKIERKSIIIAKKSESRPEVVPSGGFGVKSFEDLMKEKKMKAQAQAQEQTEEHVPEQIDQIQPEQQSEQAEQVEQITDQVENQEPYSENTENTENTTETQAENIPEQSEVPEGYQQPEEVWNEEEFADQPQ